jgi:hypothetical protein
MWPDGFGLGDRSYASTVKRASPSWLAPLACSAYFDHFRTPGLNLTPLLQPY